jgi:catechol 2,3-dioxygenase-like lactoylglutathione lyase family enzyme
VLRSRALRRVGLLLLLIATLPALLAAQSSTSGRGRALQIGPVVMTVGDMDRSVEFYTRVLTFENESDVERSGPAVDALYGVPNAQVRAVDLKLGDETIELLQFIGTVGTPIPIDARSNDLSFQHVAIIVSDMDRAYKVLRQNNVQHISPYPQRLPDWNPNAAGIKAFYFRDPDGHPLEILQFPPDKGDPNWHVSNGRLFLGIDHTAIAVSSTDTSLAFYRSLLGLHVVAESDNYGFEQEHMNNVFGAHLRITSLRGQSGIGVELLEYITRRARSSGEHQCRRYFTSRDGPAGGQYCRRECGLAGCKKSSDFGESNFRLRTPIPCEPGGADSRPRRTPVVIATALIEENLWTDVHPKRQNTSG